MAVRLEEIRLSQSTLKGNWFDYASADPAYASTFQDYGIDVQALGVDAAVERIRASPIRKQLIAALDDWAWVKGPESGAQLRALADAADDNEWRRRFRKLAGEQNRRALEELADAPELSSLHPASIVLLVRSLVETGATEKAAQVLIAAQMRAPN